MKPFALFLALIQPVHSWYPWACCSDQDCHPTEAVEANGGFDAEGHHISRADTKISQDGQYHICVLNGRVLCFFAPANG